MKIVAGAIGCALILVGAFVLGQMVNQKSIEDRVKDVDTDCYTELQLEYIIFGSPQT